MSRTTRRSFMTSAAAAGVAFSFPSVSKAAMANEDKGNFADAIKLYERIKSEYSETIEGKEMDKYISRAKASGNL